MPASEIAKMRAGTARKASGQALNLPESLLTKRGSVKTIAEALRFISRELPAELSAQPRWTFAKALLQEAERTRKKRDLSCAYRQLRQALENDRLLQEKPTQSAAQSE